MTSKGTDEFHGELAEWLGESGDGVERVSGASCDAYRVECVLKRSTSELTQLVWLRRADGGELGPYVRKYIAAGSGLGSAYRELWEAQRGGRHFRHLPHLIDVCEEASASNARLVVVMEYVSGCTLREVIEGAEPAQRLAVAARLMPAVADAVAELHESFSAPIIHRDLTPGNIICPEADPLCPVLIDLGIARSWHEGAESDTTHFGTKAYAPPEQFGFGQTDVRSDVYALGMLALFCLLGRDPRTGDREWLWAGYAVRPGEGSDSKASIPAEASGGEAPLGALVPEPWRRVLARATALDPRERYQSARTFGDAVRECCGSDATPDAVSIASAGACQSLHADEAACFQSESEAGDQSTIIEGRSASESKPLRFWCARNVIVVPAALLLLAASVGCAVDPSRYRPGYPVWYELYGYLVLMPVYIVCAAYLLMDKRWLRAHVAFFRLRSPRELRRIALLLAGLVTAALFVLTIVGQQTGVLPVGA